MRLLDTTTKKIHEFLQDVPPYAILSHRWGKPSEEITFQDLQTPNWNRLEGYSKLFNACQRVRADGFKFLWLDTCCIDKTNSSELSEAINSMYKYYENAEICYAYLQDVQKTSPVDMDALKASFVRSRWFTRGWTLQELLAPRFLVFCDQTWKKLGSREDWSQEIEKASGIQPQYLENPRSCCVAMKFSWAKNRTTTRIEDQAYSLLGLFECNMPLLYGEGMLAFRRLQLELIKNHDDETIFTWYTGLGGKLDVQSPFDRLGTLITLNEQVPISRKLC